MSAVQHTYQDPGDFFQDSSKSDFDDIILYGLKLSNEAIYSQSSSQVRNQLLVHHNTYLRFQGIEYQAETGIVQFIPDGSKPTSRSICYELLGHEFFFNNPAYGGSTQKYIAYIHPHQLMSMLFIGTGMDQQLSLYLELNELGELVAYYCRQDAYNGYQCQNQVELFVTNVVMSQILASILQPTAGPVSSQLGYIIKESLNEIDYERINPGALRRHLPAAGALTQMDIIPALQCIGTHFAVQNLFPINIFPILNQIQLGVKGFIQTVNGQGNTPDFPVHSYYLSRFQIDAEVMQQNGQLDSFFSYILGVYRRHSDMMFYRDIEQRMKDTRPYHLQYIESLRQGLAQSYSYSDINIFDQVAVHTSDQSVKYDKFDTTPAIGGSTDMVSLSGRAVGDGVILHPLIQGVVMFGAWSLLNNGYRPDNMLSNVLKAMSEDYTFEVFNALGVFLDNNFEKFNHLDSMGNLQSGARIGVCEYTEKVVEL